MKKNNITKIGTITLAGVVLLASPVSFAYASTNYCEQETHDWTDRDGDFVCDICGGELPSLPSGTDLFESLGKGRTEEDYIPSDKLPELPDNADISGSLSKGDHEEGDYIPSDKLPELPDNADIFDSLTKGDHTEGDYIPSDKLPELPDNADIFDSLTKGNHTEGDYIPSDKPLNEAQALSLEDDFLLNYKSVSVNISSIPEGYEDLENLTSFCFVFDYDEVITNVYNTVLGIYPDFDIYNSIITLKDIDGNVITAEKFNSEDIIEVYASIILNEPETSETESIETTEETTEIESSETTKDDELEELPSGKPTCETLKNKNCIGSVGNVGEGLNDWSTQHFDSNKDGVCDGCNMNLEYVEITHIFEDKNDDCECDTCGLHATDVSLVISKGKHPDYIPPVPSVPETSETTESTEETESSETSEIESSETESPEETSTEETETTTEETSTEYGKVDPDDPEGNSQLTWIESTETESSEIESTETESSETSTTESTEETSIEETETTTEESTTEDTTTESNETIDTSDTQNKTKNYGMYFLISALGCVLPVFKKFIK